MMRTTGRQIAMLLLFAVLVCSVSTGAYAAEDNDAASSATFQFTAGDGTIDPTPPVDPEQPIYIIDPDPDEDGNNGVTGNTGRLRIDYVSDFKFGKQVIQSGDQRFYAKLVSADAEHTDSKRIDVPNFVQVSDLRGSGAGWKLLVKQDDQFTVSAGQYDGTKMNGARITLKNIISNTARENDIVSVASEEIMFDTMNEYYNLLVAEPMNGIGTHVAHFGEYNQGAHDSALKSVVLDIPATASKVEAVYKTSFTWILADVPGTDGNGGGSEEIDGGEEGGTIDIDGDEWIILRKDEEEGIAELIRKESVRLMSYYSEKGGSAWSDSDIRSWLRNEFRDSLSEKLSSMIIEVEKDTNLPVFFSSIPKEQQYETVYLLSYDEYKYYRDLYPDLYKQEDPWWLRTPYLIYSGSGMMTAYTADNTNNKNIWQTDASSEKGVRPVISVSYK